VVVWQISLTNVSGTLDSYIKSLNELDRRNVSGAGVAHVMRAFAASFAGIELPPPAPQAAEADAATARLAALMDVHCDELLLDER